MPSVKRACLKKNNERMIQKKNISPTSTSTSTSTSTQNSTPHSQYKNNCQIVVKTR